MSHVCISTASLNCNVDLFALIPVDNGTREGLDKFLKAASKDPETVLHYEFMQDYKVSNLGLDASLTLLSLIIFHSTLTFKVNYKLSKHCLTATGSFEASGWPY